ncbi:MAG TPA: S9 family peptidase, partial [Candidatus Bilophila faecipullorum]|nr:S9 family peptidase [Candidatus Bilophila faecipullorum]
MCYLQRAAGPGRNGLPQDKPDGYDLPSPVYYADGLKGRLLLMHGSADDNVHPQN